MTWFKVDDTLAFHPKAIAAGNAALGLWVRAGTWCSQQLTDGYLPTEMARQMGTRAQATKLVEVGLWKEAPGGYQFHDWTDWNPTRLQIEADRYDRRARAKNAAQKRWDNR